MHPEISVVASALNKGRYPEMRYYHAQLDLGRAIMSKKLGIADLHDYVGV